MPELVALRTNCRSAEVVTDTPDRTSSEDEHNPVHVDTGLPPIAPVKVTKASLLSEGVAATKDGGEHNKSPKTKNVAKTKTPKKVAASVDRRRKRKTKDATGISQASAVKLFQCSCQLLRTQTLDYDVRAREMEDRNAKQTKEIDKWEKKIHSLKRELEEYADEQPRNETTALALVDAVRTVDEQPNPLTAATESSLPPTVIATEAKLQEELRKRTHQLNEFCRSVPGFIESLDEQTSHQF